MQSLLWLVLGLALFLFGLHTLSVGLRRGAGQGLRRWLAALTSNRLRGLLTGTLVTSIIQSSSATNVMVIGLAQAGLLELGQAISVMLGANIGTTATSQLMALNIGALAPLFVAIGLLVHLGAALGQGATLMPRRTIRVSGVGGALVGLGSLLIGMDTMRLALAPLADNAAVYGLMAGLSANPFVAIGAGALFTGAVQSSSMTTGMTMAMTATGMIDLRGALGLVLGANVGTVVTTLLASIGTTTVARRAAIADLVFNVAGVALFAPLLPTFARFVQATSARPEQQVANAHALFNIVTAVAVLPFIPQLVRFVTVLVNDGRGQD